MARPSFRAGETSGNNVGIGGSWPIAGGTLDIDVGIDIPGIGTRPPKDAPANMPPGTGGGTNATIAGISTGTLLGLVGLALAFRK